MAQKRKRGRPRKTVAEKKTRMIGFWVTESDFKKLKAAAESKDMTVAHYARHMTFATL